MFAFIVTTIALIINLVYSWLAASGMIPQSSQSIAVLLGYAILLGGLAVNLVALMLGVIGVARKSSKRLLGMFSILIAAGQIVVELALLFPLVTGHCWRFFCF